MTVKNFIVLCVSREAIKSFSRLQEKEKKSKVSSGTQTNIVTAIYYSILQEI